MQKLVFELSASFSNFLSKIRPEKFFLILASVFGFLFITLTPPMQVPDEPNHFYRAWQISEGTFNSKVENKRVGGELPKAVQTFAKSFDGLIWSGTDVKYRMLPLDFIWDQKTNKNERVFLDFNNTALYTSVCYLPAALGIFIFKQFPIPIIIIFYAARLCNLVFWIFIIWLVIKRLPIYKWLFCFLALLPMSIFINSSLSADVVTNALCFLFIANVFYLKFSDAALTSQDLLLLFFLVFLLIAVKTFYSPLALLVLFIPPHKFGSNINYVVKMAALALFAIVVMGYFSHSVDAVYLSYENYNTEYRDAGAFFPGADLHKQLAFMKTQSLYGTIIIANSVFATFPVYFHQAIGIFGWLTLPFPKIISTFLILMLIVVAAFDSTSEKSFLIWQKAFSFVLFFILLCLVFLSQYLIFNPAGNTSVGGIQGRYMIPFFALLLFPFYKSFPSKPQFVSVIVIFCCLFSLVYSVILLVSRYFI